MFISRQFWVYREKNRWGAQRLFEAMQMVPSTHAKLQVMSALLWIFEEKILPGPKKSKNVPKTAKIEDYIHTFGLSRGLSFKHYEMPPRDMGGHWKEACGLEQIYGCLYVLFETILGLSRNEQMGCSKAFRGNANGAEHPRKVISYDGTPMNVTRENMTRPKKVQKFHKNSQNWRL